MVGKERLNLLLLQKVAFLTVQAGVKWPHDGYGRINLHPLLILQLPSGKKLCCQELQLRWTHLDRRLKMFLKISPSL